LLHEDDIRDQYDFDALWAGALYFLVEEQIIKKDEMGDCAITLIYAIHGILTLFLSGNGPTEEELFDNVDKIIEFTLRR
jgi:hypothetical protein